MTKANEDDGPNLSEPPSISGEDENSSQIFSSLFSFFARDVQEIQRPIPTIVNVNGTADDEARERFQHIGNNSDTDNTYWVEPGTAEIVVEVMGEHVPEFLLQICGVKLCQSRKRWIARALCIGVFLSILTIAIATITMIVLRNDSTELKIIETDLSPLDPSIVPLSNPSSAPSSKPSFPPLLNDERSKNITKVIFDVSGDQIYDPVTPQGQALRWILEYDGMKLIYNSSNILQRYSMMVIFYSLDGSNWFIKNGYRSSQHECN